MCLIISAIAAAVFFAICILKKNHTTDFKNELTVALAFCTASLMWCVDGFTSVLEGESFFDISMSDFVLGLIIAACGCALYIALVIKSHFFKAKK